MNISEADVIWTRGTDQVRVERHLSGWQRTAGDYWMPAYCLGEMGEAKRSPVNDLLGMFLLFHTITVRDRVDAQKTHKAFLAIDDDAPIPLPTLASRRSPTK
jgi:hypothetical protein